MAEETNGMEQTPMVNDQTTPEPVDVNQAEPTIEVPKVETAEQPEVPVVKAEEPKVEAVKAEEPKVETVKAEEPKVENKAVEPVQPKPAEAKPVQPKKPKPVQEVKIDPVKAEKEFVENIFSPEEKSKRLFNYDGDEAVGSMWTTAQKGANKKGKDPYIEKSKPGGYQLEEAPEFQLNPAYKSPSKKEFDSMADFALKNLYSQGNFDLYKNDPSNLADYVNKYVDKISMKSGFYLSKEDKNLLAKRIVEKELPDFITLQEDIIPAIRKSGIVSSAVKRQVSAEKEIAQSYSDLKQKSNAEELRIKKEVDDLYANDVQALDKEKVSVDEAIKTNSQSLFDSYFEAEYNSRLQKLQQQVNDGSISRDDALKLITPNQEGKSILSEEIVNLINNSREFKSNVEAFAKPMYDDLNRKAYDLNSKIRSSFNEKMKPIDDSINKEYKQAQKIAQSKSGFTQEDMKKLDAALYDIAKARSDAEYARSKKLAGTASMIMWSPDAWKVIGQEFASKLESSAKDIISGMYNNLTRGYVNEMDVKASIKRMKDQGINASVLFEREGWGAAFNPGIIAGTIGQQLPIVAEVMIPAAGAGTVAMNAGRLLNLSRWAVRAFGGIAGGATEAAIVGQMVIDETRSRAIGMGASPEDIRKAEGIALETWLPTAPIYFVQMGALLDKSLSFTKKVGVEYATEFFTEHGEAVASEVGLKNITPELDSFGNPTGRTKYKGLAATVSEYLSSPQFKEVSAATVWTTAIVGTGLQAIGSNQKSKIEKSTLYDMFYHAGRVVPDVILRQNEQSGKISKDEFNLGMAKIQNMHDAINAVSEMDISDDNIIFAAVDKLYDINTLQGQLDSTQDENVKNTLQAKIDKAKKELNDITMEKVPVYIRHNPGTGPMIMTAQDMEEASNNPEVLEAASVGAVKFSIINDNNMVAKITESVKQYRGLFDEKVKQMSETSSEEGKMSVNEAYELAKLQARQAYLNKAGKDLSPVEMGRMSDLLSKGPINLAAYDRRIKERAKLLGSNEAFLDKAKKAMSRFLPKASQDIVTNKEDFIAGSIEALSSLNGVTNVTYDAPSKSFNVEYQDGNSKNIKLSNISGFNMGGRVYVNPENKSIDTLVHELGGHSWVNNLVRDSRIANVQLAEGSMHSIDEILNADDADLNEAGRKLKEGLNLMRDTDYYEELKLSDFYAGMSEGAILEEALVQAIGEKGALRIKRTKANADGTISVDPTRLERLINWIKDIVRSITGINPKENQALPDYITSALKQILGSESIEREISQEELNRLAQPSGFTDANGNPLNNREVNFMVRNDLVADYASEIRFEYIKDSEEFKRLLEGDPANGIPPSITADRTLSDFAGQYIIFHVPDNSFTGEIFKGNDKIVDGKGGIYYVVKFNKDGYFWASTEGGATVFVNFLNSVRANSKDGKIRMALVSARQDKLLSSTINSNGLLDIMFSKALDDRIKLSTREVASAYVAGINYAKDEAMKKIDANAKKKNWSPSKVKELKSEIKFPKILKGDNPETVSNKLKEFFQSDVSDFEERKDINIGMLMGIANEAKVKFKDKPEAFKNFSAQFLDFFGELTGNDKVKSDLGNDIKKISGESLVKAVSNFLSEPLLKGQEKGKVYAIIELDSDVEPYDTRQGGGFHESYPIAIRAKDRSKKPILHILQDRQGWLENSVDAKTGEKISESMMDKILPTQRGVSSVVKLSDNIKKIETPKGQPKFKIEGDAVKPIGKVFTTPHYQAEAVANDYVLDNNLPPIAKTIVKALDIDTSMKIADAYDALESKPNDPEVIAAYTQMGEESVKQFDHMVKSGYSIEVYTGDGEPYATAADMIKDLNENKHLYILKTDEGAFGQIGDFDKMTEDTTAKSPLLESSERFDINGVELLNNDVFRAVHDFFGHAVMGNSFGPVGEENAWLIHSQMYSPLARRAMTSETRMQNSWVNFNRSMRTVEEVVGEETKKRPAKAGEEGFVPLSQRDFAKQKAALSPDWVVDTSVYLKQYPIIGDDSQVKFKVNDENFPKDKNVNAIRNSDIYGEMTEDGKGNFVFFHVSWNDKLDKIGVNPNKFGLNSLKTGAEERMRSVPVSMYYVNTESDIKYSTKYFTKIPKNKVYYFNADALKLKDKAKAAFEADVKKKGYNLAYTPNEQVGYMLLEARKLGYEMVIAKWGDGKVRAETNVVIKPEKFFNLIGNAISYVNRERFLNNKDKAKNKKIAKSDMLASERTYEWYEKSVSRLLSSGISKDDFIQMMQTGKFVIMTSENPDNKDHFEYENDNFISEFEDEMTRRELNYIPVIGKYGKFERSFIITDTDAATAKELAERFNQESVAADFGIYYPAKKIFNPRVKGSDVFIDGQMSADDDFMSTIKTTDGPVTFALSYDFETDKKLRPKFQIVGLEGAKNVSSIVNSYNAALKMEIDGMSPKQIFAATGWFRDFAGNMAYDIDDINSEIKIYPPEGGAPLSEVLDHPMLYQMYPKVKDIVVKSYNDPNSTDHGSLITDSKGNNTILVNSSAIDKNNLELLYQTIVHEVQHVIQVIEGFDDGSSVKQSLSQLNYIRDSIIRMNEALKSGKVKLSDVEYERYVSGIEIDEAIIKSIDDIIKRSKESTEDFVAYWYNYGEMMARYSETPLSKKEIRLTPLSTMMNGNFVTLSIERIQNIHDAFFVKSGKITSGPGKKINIPGFRVEDDIQRKQILNEAMARGVSMKAGANYYSGVKETAEQKEERLKLRDQLMLELMAAKQAYDQRSAEAATAAEYEQRKRDIEEAFRMQDMENRISAKLNRKIRREQVISAFRWLGEKEKWQDKIANWNGMKQLLFDRIEEYRKNGELAGKINGRTLSTFSKMILNATTEKRLNRALAYLDKALEDKQYGELVGNIRDLKAAIKNMTRGGKNPFGNYYDSVIELISYDESNLFNPYGERSFAVMEMYRDMLDQLARKDMPNFKSYMNNFHLIQDMLEASVDNEIADQAFNEVQTASELNKYIDKFYDLPINNEVDYMAIRKISAAINKRATELYSQGVITADEYANIFAKVSKGSRSSEITQDEVRNKVRAMEAEMFSFAYYRMNLLDPNQFSGDNKKAFFKLRLMLNKPNGIEDFRNAGTDSIILLEKIVNQLENGFMSYRIHELMNTIEVQADSKRLADEVSAAISENAKKPFRRRFSSSALDIASTLTGMPKQIVDQALGLGKTKPFYDTVASKLGRSFSALRLSNKELGRMVYRSLQTYGGLLTMPEVERYRVGLILKQLDYQSNTPNFESDDTIKDVTKYLINEKSGEITAKEFKAIQKAYESLPKDNNGDLDVEAALKSLSKREKNLYNTARTLFDKHLSARVSDTNARRGEIAENQTNYYRRFSQGVRSSELADNVAPEEFVRQLETYKVRSGSTKSRVSNGLYWTVIDPEAVLFRSINDVNTDYYLSQDIPRAFSVLREASKKSKGQAKTIIDALSIMTRETLVDELTINRNTADPAGLFSLEGLTTRASNMARNLLLSNPARIVTEMVPSVSKYLMSEANVNQLISFFTNIKSQNGKLYRKLFYDHHLPFRDNIARYSLEGGDSGRRSTTAALADAVSTLSDALFSKGVFKLAFDDSFKKLTGEDFDIERYYSDERYRARIEALGVMDQAITDGLYRAERLASSLTQFTSPTKIGFNRKSSAYAKVFGFMMSYNAFEAKMFFENLRDVISGENEGRIAAARYTSGVIASNTAYGFLGYFMNQLFKSLDFDDDDPIDEEILEAVKATSDKKSAGNLLMTSSVNLLLGGYGVIGKLGIGFLLGLIESLSKSGYKMTDEQKKKYDEISAAAMEYARIKTIDFSSRYGATSVSDALSFIPLFGIYVTPVIDASTNYAAVYDKKSRGETVTNEEEATYRAIVALHALANFAGLQYPGIGLIHKSLNSSANESAKKSKAMKEFMKKWGDKEVESPANSVEYLQDTDLYTPEEQEYNTESYEPETNE